MTTTRALTRKFSMRNLLLALALLASLALRLWRIDEFISVDEHNWRTRSIEFYQGLVSGDYIQTCRTEHPGVLTMWAGVAGYRIAGRLEGAQIEAPWLRAVLYPRGHDQGVGLYPETLWARRVIALTTWLGIVGLYLLGRRFLPARVNLASTILVALDPFTSPSRGCIISMACSRALWRCRCGRCSPMVSAAAQVSWRYRGPWPDWPRSTRLPASS